MAEDTKTRDLSITGKREEALLHSWRAQTLTREEREWLAEFVTSCADGKATRASREIPWRIRGIMTECQLPMQPDGSVMPVTFGPQR